MASTVNTIPGYPTVYLTEDKKSITIRPMVSRDKPALLDFFRRIPQEDRFYLKDDVTSPKVIEQWAANLNYSRVLPLLAIMDGKVVGDGTLHFRRAGARRHIGEVRVVVDPDYRNRGVGRALLGKLTEAAMDRGLEKLMFEVVVDTEPAAMHTARVLGFVPEAVLPAHVKDYCGNNHDLMIMELRLPKYEAREAGIF